MSSQAFPISANTPRANTKTTVRLRIIVLKAVVTLVFAVAIIGKLLDFPAFLRSVSAIDALPYAFVALFAILLLLAESAAAVLVWHLCTQKFAALGSAFLAAAFAIYSAINLTLGYSTECACFGVFLTLPLWATLIIDYVLLALSIILFVLLSRPAAEEESIGTNAFSLAPVAASVPRLPLLIGVMLVCAMGFLSLLPNDPILHSQIVSFFNPNRLAATYDPITPELRQNDPLLGTRLPLPINPTENNTKPVLVVMMSSCSICALGGLVLTEQLGKNIICQLFLCRRILFRRCESMLSSITW